MKKVSAIIVNWNGKKFTVDCVESLLRQDYPAIEIIVSDNGSTDGSIETLREKYPQVKLLENGSNLGFGAAVNKGIEAGEGDYFLFLNNDLVLREDAVGKLANVMAEEPSAGAVVPKILYFEKRETINSFGIRVNYTSVCCPNLIDCKDSEALESWETACGGIFMFRQEVYEEVGGFDSDLFLYHEDHDLSWRIRLAGWRILVTPKAMIYHHYHFNKGVFKFYSSEKNRLFLLLKNLEWKTLFLISPALILVELAQIIHALVHGWLGLKFKSYFEILGLTRQILCKRRHLQNIRKVSDSEIVRLYEGKLKVGGVKNLLIDYILSPTLDLYWRLIRHLI